MHSFNLSQVYLWGQACKEGVHEVQGWDRGKGDHSKKLQVSYKMVYVLNSSKNKLFGTSRWDWSFVKQVSFNLRHFNQKTIKVNFRVIFRHAPFFKKLIFYLSRLKYQKIAANMAFSISLFWCIFRWVHVYRRFG